MTEHNLFYYPYASFTNSQLPLLKAAALYFDKLIILDPEKASGGIVGAEDVAQDVALLESEGLLERVAPEEILLKYEDRITNAIRADLQDPQFEEHCIRSRREKWWTLALAKVPKEIRDDPSLKPKDRVMQRMMGDTAQALAPEMGAYMERYGEVDIKAYDETRRGASREIEYRYAEFPLALGEAIMINHALFAGLLYANATPITDESFHSKALALKLRRAAQEPVIQQTLTERARTRQLKADQLAVASLTDVQLNLSVLDPQLPLEEVLEYRQKHDDALKQARDKLGWMTRRIETEPWSEEFAEEIEHKTIPDLAEELDEARKARDKWLKSKRGKLALKAAGVALGTAGAVLAVLVEPLTPVALATAGLSLATGTAIPGAEWLQDWRDGKKTARENGLHYLLSI